MPELSALFQDLTNNLPRKGKAMKAKHEEVLGFVIHHEPSYDSVWELTRAQIKVQETIGYHFVIEDTGIIYMSLAPDERGHHSFYTRGDNIKLYPNQDPLHYDDWYLGVALVGEFVNAKQVEALVQLATAFMKSSPKFKVLGHRELPGAGCACPGTDFSLEYVRQEALRRLEDKSADVSWMKSYVSPKDAAVAMKSLLDSRESLLIRSRDKIRESMLSLRSAITSLSDLEREITREMER